MKRLFGIFVLTVPEQRLVIFVILLLVAGAWVKHQRDLKGNAAPEFTAASPSPTPTLASSPNE